MTWETVLKALPKPDNVAGLLTTEQGVAYIEGEAKKDDKKNIIRVKNKVTALSNKKQIPQEFKDKEDEIAANALKLVNVLNEILTEENVRAQQKGTVSSKFDKILESLKEGDTGPLKAFVGKGLRSWSGKTRTKKKDLLMQNKSEIIEAIDKDDVDLLYYSTDKVYKTTQVEAFDEIKEALEGAEVTKTDDEVTVTLPEKISPDMFNQVRDVINRLEQRKTGQRIRFTRTGGFKKSALLDLFGDTEISDRVQREIDVSESKTYENQVTDAEDALNYLKLLGLKGWRKKMEFMPTPKTKSKKALQNARSSLLGNNVTVSTSLETLLKSPSLNLKQMIESGEEIKLSRNVPKKLVSLLEKDVDKQSKYYRREDLKDKVKEKVSEDHPSGVSKEKIQELQEIYRRQSEEFPKFYKYITGSKKDDAVALRDDFKALENYYRGQGTNLFTDDEVEMFKKLRGKDELEINQALSEFYEKDDLLELAFSVEEIFNAKEGSADLFTSIRENANKLNYEGIPVELAKEFVNQIKLLRKDSEMINISMTEGDTVSDLLRELKATGTHSGESSPVEMLRLLISLDFYYGTRELNAIRNDMYDAEEEEDEEEEKKLFNQLLTEAQSSFSTIMDGLVESVKQKVQDIIDNTSQYLQLLQLEIKGGEDKLYKLMGRLSDEGLVKEVQE